MTDHGYVTCRVNVNIIVTSGAIQTFTSTMGRGRGTFGLTSNRGKRGSGSRFGYRGNNTWRGGRGRGRGGTALPSDAPAPVREDDGTQFVERFEKVALSDEIDEKMGFARVEEGAKREGWLINMRPVRPTACYQSF